MGNRIQLKDVELAYNDGPAVLKIENLEVPKGKMVFITGPSGIGKSTLLEALALMSDTVRSQNTSIFSLSDLGEGVLDLLSVWSYDSSELSRIRRENFSFIFQTTNLMPNFTLGENMAFAGLLSGKSLDIVNKDIYRLMGQLQLDEGLYENRPSEASGGQRQRIAFVRALSKQFTVLFGDEPTGNLDDSNARILFNILKKEIHSKGSSAVIVSHHMGLAGEFADVEIRIKKVESEKSPTGFMGLIDESCIIHRN